VTYTSSTAKAMPMNRVKAAEKRRRRQRDEVRRENLQHQRDRRICGQIVEDLGFRELGIEGDVIAPILASRSGRVQLRDATGGGSEPLSLLQSVRAFMKQERWTPPTFSHSYSYEEYFTLVRPAMALLFNFDSQLGSPTFGGSDRGTAWRTRLNDLERIDKEFRSWASCEMGNIFGDFCRMYDSLYYFRHVSERTQEGTDRDVWELHRVRPERVRLLVNGEPRWVFRCGQSIGRWTSERTDGVEWLTWNTATLGLEPSARQLPVYVQPHVFERLYGPQGRLRALQHYEGDLHHFVFESLKTPIIRPLHLQPDSYLVEYRFDMCKLGYLVCQILPDAVVARTFLFLTMDGTPEGDQLFRHLRVNRYDKAHLGLDDLHTLIATDLRSNPELRPILDDCGIGHLFDSFGCGGSQVTGHADVCCRYLDRGTGNDLRRNLRRPFISAADGELAAGRSPTKSRACTRE